MKKLTFLLAFVISLPLFGQEYKAQFTELIEKSDLDGAEALLTEWSVSEPENAEMFIGWFNLYMVKSRSEVVRMDSEPGPGQNLEIKDTATAETVGYMYSEIVYDDSLFYRGQEYLLKALEYNPDRLDIYFGRIYSLREKGELEQHIVNILDLIDLFQEEERVWLWTDNETIQNPAEMFRGAIQEYSYVLFNMDPPEIEAIQRISGKMLEYYPESVENMSNIGVCYLLAEEYSKATEIFSRALEIDPDDAIVIGNIAYSLMLDNDFEEAISYYRRLIEIVGEEEGEFARQQITYMENELKKK